jgi:RNA-directed DNA polymerase
MSYKEGVGTIKNAEMHVAQNFLLKMDFQDFFPSIKGDDILNLIAVNIMKPPFSGLSAKDRDVIIKIACKKNQLTIGAPSSPAISNAVLYQFDQLMHDESVKRGVIYSRYADDLAFSTNRPNVLAEILEIVKKALVEQASPRLRINFDKTIFASRKRRRVVTGLILTPEKKVSIGRDKKREIKALCYQFGKGSLSVDAASYLRGYLSYVNSVEPAFIESLRDKYGSEVMERILEATPVRRK